MESFEYSANPGRVVFGSGSIKKLPDEVKRLNKTKPLLLSTPQQAEQVKALEPILRDGGITPAGLYSNATMHTPTHVTEEALKYANDCGADCVISFGGGSTIGLGTSPITPPSFLKHVLTLLPFGLEGKAISIRTGLEHVTIPTTYAGSEMTPILGETADGRKTTRSDRKILPGTTIYDVDFTMTLPEALSATSGVNAIAHAGPFD
jgi:alcohol dehydrogenase class IV